MKLLCDENVPLSVISYLRSVLKYDVKSITMHYSPGLSDEQVLTESIKSRRTLVTFDKDFLTSTGRRRTKIIFLSLSGTQPKNIIPYLKALMEKVEEITKRKKCFVIRLNKQSLVLSSAPSECS